MVARRCLCRAFDRKRDLSIRDDAITEVMEILRTYADTPEAGKIIARFSCMVNSESRKSIERKILKRFGVRHGRSTHFSLDSAKDTSTSLHERVADNRSNALETLSHREEMIELDIILKKLSAEDRAILENSLAKPGFDTNDFEVANIINKIRLGLE